MKNAFTLLELIFVLVIVGILSAIIVSNTKHNHLQLAAIQLASHIRYTQSLALLDDKYNSNNVDKDNNIKWYKERWQLVFGRNKSSDYQYGYTIFSDTSGDSTGGANKQEIAIDPQNSSRVMSGGHTGTTSLDINHKNFKGMKKLNLGLSYGVTSVNFSGGCKYARISFDHLGRPLQGNHSTMTSPYGANYQRLITKKCIITLSDGLESASISIEPETGYTKINF